MHDDVECGWDPVWQPWYAVVLEYPEKPRASFAEQAAGVLLNHERCGLRIGGGSDDEFPDADGSPFLSLLLAV